MDCGLWFGVSILDWAVARLAGVGRAADSGYESLTRCNGDEEGAVGILTSGD
jgi:hypothetical protein